MFNSGLKRHIRMACAYGATATPWDNSVLHIQTVIDRFVRRKPPYC